MPAPTRRPLARGLRHVLYAGVLGVVAAMIGSAAVVMGLFGGSVAVIVAVLAVMALVSVLAVAIDRTSGPGLGNPGGSTFRGTVLGVTGCALTLVLGFVALDQRIGHDWPIPLRYAAAAPVFALVAALQWPGALRRVALGLLAVAAAIGVVQRVEGVTADRREQALVEIGTTAHPWVTEIEGLEGLAPRATGSEFLWTDYVRDGEPTPVVSLLRMPSSNAMGGDPCRGKFRTPEGPAGPASCHTTDGVTWRREARGEWLQLVRRIDGTWIGATARAGVPEDLLEEALANARPMDDDAYDDWLDVMLTVPLS